MGATIILTISALANLLLGWIVFLRSSRRPVYWWYTILSTATVFWITANIFTGLLKSIWIFRFTYTIGGALPFLAYSWYRSFQHQKFSHTKLHYFLILATVFFSTIPLVDGLIVADAESFFLGGISGKLGPLYPAWATFVFASILYTLWIITRDYQTARGIRKLQIRYVLLGFYGFALFPITVSVVLPNFGVLNLTWLDSFGSVPLVVATGLAIIRYRFLDIRAVIFRSLAFGAIVFIITGIFSIISALFTYLFAELAGLQSNILSGVILAVLVTVFYKPLRDIIERATNTFLYKKSYDPDVLIARVNHITSSTLDFAHLLRSISHTLTEAFHADKLGVALINKKSKLYIAHQEGFPPGVAEGLARGNERVMFEQFKRTPGIFVIEERKTEYENGENLQLFVKPELMLAMHAQDLAIIVPLRLQDKLIGVVTIGNKKSGEPYNSQDLRVLKIVSGQLAVSIENALLYEEQKHFAEVLKDEVRKATQELRAANAELRRLDATKSEFISIASHQLRTPLTIIKGFISMINEQAFGKVPPLIHKQLDKVYEANERLIGLVEDLLNISRIESGRQVYTWEPTDCYEMAAGVVESLKPQAEKKELTLVLEKPAKPLPKPVVDKDKLHEVMINFIDNAVKYTEKGSIRVALLAQPAGYLTFSVQDSGMGMSKETIAHLFQKFSRGRGSALVHTEGTGLGLYVAKKIVDIHEGMIGAESKGEGKGSAFSFSIPLAGPKVRPQQPKERTLKIKTPEQLAEEAKR